MRQIKFRGQRLDNKQWVYGNLISISKESSNSTTELTTGIQVIENGNFKAVFQVSAETIGQFTGLANKGTDIYEGDLISLGDEHWESDGTPDIKEIVFDEDSASFRIYDYMELQGSSLAEKWYMDDVIADVEVIGNIHENPELLNYL